MRVGGSLRLALVSSAVLFTAEMAAYSQAITTTSNGTLTAVVNFTVTPANSNTPISNQVQFRVRSKNNTGYRVQASVVYSMTPSAADDGGSRIAASDIGVGITSISYASGVATPRTETIRSGFNYTPSSVTATNGLTPYTGMASGKATLADIVSNPNLKILNGLKIANSDATSGPNSTTNYVTVTMEFALLPQYFTPGTFSAVITLTVLDGQ